MKSESVFLFLSDDISDFDWFLAARELFLFGHLGLLVASPFAQLDQFKDVVTGCGDQKDCEDKGYLLNGAKVRGSHEECEVCNGLRHLQSRKCWFLVV